jgi:hypothetical protein
MSLTINHETNEITNATGTVTINGTAVIIPLFFGRVAVVCLVAVIRVQVLQMLCST